MYINYDKSDTYVQYISINFMQFFIFVCLIFFFYFYFWYSLLSTSYLILLFLICVLNKIPFTFVGKTVNSHLIRVTAKNI